ncbi:G-protein coupled receptor 26 isoform X2 [Mus pahari]|uniref:G-protein coupled receptor 26 isoform X2 n=1 Tax=Mus pahari TaxID=10093 RepID=UPI0011149579|nr:G-protein coupled receptor 26 isoform X2 [Mus pahari]
MNSWDAGLAGLLVGTIGVSLLSNGLVLLCLLHSADIRRQAPALFTLNLTCGNLLCTVVNMPLTLAGVVAQRQPAGDRLCRLAAFLDTFLAANSMLSMAALSIDRWVAVVFPLSYRAKMRLRDAAFMVAYTWLHALTFPATALALSWLGFHQLYASCTLCSRRPDERLRFAVFTSVFHALSFLLSFIVLCFTYLKVLKVARFHCKRIDVITMQTLVLLVDIHPSQDPKSGTAHDHNRDGSFHISDNQDNLPQCEGTVSGGTEAKATACHQEDQHLHRDLPCVLCTLCDYQAGGTLLHSTHWLSLGCAVQVLDLQQGCF